MAVLPTTIICHSLQPAAEGGDMTDGTLTHKLVQQVYAAIPHLLRQPVVDRVVFALLNQRVPLAQDPSAGSGQAGRLDDRTRTTLAKRVNERLETEELYAHRKLRLRTIIQSQARRLAVWVRGEGKACEPWVARW
jgi:CRISPR/Cas system-associated endonuclease Cas1